MYREVDIGNYAAIVSIRNGALSAGAVPRAHASALAETGNRLEAGYRPPDPDGAECGPDWRPVLPSSTRACRSRSQPMPFGKGPVAKVARSQIVSGSKATTSAANPTLNRPRS